MNDFQTLAVSAAGMALERSRLEWTTLNLANANTVAAPGQPNYRPMQVLARYAGGGAAFGGLVNAAGSQVSVQPQALAEREVLEPGHPQADSRGIVRYPGVNSATEMMTAMTALRAYEANVAAFNITRSMALKALEIGG